MITGEIKSKVDKIWDAFTIPTPALLAKVVDMIDQVTENEGTR